MSNVGTLGRHLIVEMWGCEGDVANNPDKIMKHLRKAAIDSGATIIKSFFHEFSPVGVTGVAVLAESHISIHTWPEEGYIAADIFTCGTTTNPEIGVQSLIDGFKPESSTTLEIRRGNLETKEPLLLEPV